MPKSSVFLNQRSFNSAQKSNLDIMVENFKEAQNHQTNEALKQLNSKMDFIDLDNKLLVT